MRFPNRSDTNLHVQSQKEARRLKFWSKEEVELYYGSSEISFMVTAKLICAFVFAYADCCFSHGAVHLDII